MADTVASRLTPDNSGSRSVTETKNSVILKTVVSNYLVDGLQSTRPQG